MHALVIKALQQDKALASMSCPDTHHRISSHTATRAASTASASGKCSRKPYKLPHHLASACKSLK